MQHGVKSGRTVQQNGLDYANPQSHSWVSPEGQNSIQQEKHIMSPCCSCGVFDGSPTKCQCLEDPAPS